MAQARVAAADALAETRSFIHALAPPSLRTGGIADALRRLGATTTETTGVHVQVDVADYSPPSPPRWRPRSCGSRRAPWQTSSSMPKPHESTSRSAGSTMKFSSMS